MEENKIEIWKDIPNYEGLYQASNFGRIKSLERIVIRKDGKPYFQKEHIMKEYLRKNGYLYVALSKNGISKCKNIHRIIGETFLNWHNYKFTQKEINIKYHEQQLEINHKNSNKLDNNVDNLEWCSRSYNLQEAFRLNLNHPPAKGKFGKYNFKSKKVLQKSKNGNIIKIWDSISEAQNQLKISNISKCCKNRGYCKTAGGFRWEYVNE